MQCVHRLHCLMQLLVRASELCMAGEPNVVPRGVGYSVRGSSVQEQPICWPRASAADKPGHLWTGALADACTHSQARPHLCLGPAIRALHLQPALALLLWSCGGRRGSPGFMERACG